MLSEQVDPLWSIPWMGPPDAYVAVLPVALPGHATFSACCALVARSGFLPVAPPCWSRTAQPCPSRRPRGAACAPRRPARRPRGPAHVASSTRALPPSTSASPQGTRTPCPVDPRALPCGAARRPLPSCCCRAPPPPPLSPTAAAAVEGGGCVGAEEVALRGVVGVKLGVQQGV
ncbi:unnamed protein product [Closterium sp. NIES-54]